MRVPRRRPAPARAAGALAMSAVLGVVMAAPAHAGGNQSWQRYVIAPSSRTVTPVRVLATSGKVVGAKRLLHGGTAKLVRPQPGPKPSWPGGTTASASSYHDGNNGNDGKPRTYVPANAVDGNTDTFWNDANPDTYPATLTITSPAPVDLPGITMLSNADGVPQDFTVATWDGSAWQTAATVTGNTAVQRPVTFSQKITTTQVRITVTKNQATPKGNFTRVNEVWPGLVPDDPAPSITLDFGQDVVGYPRLDFAGASGGHPGVRLAFSETTEFLTDRSDFTRSDVGGGPGTDQYAVPAKGGQWTDTKGCQFGTRVCADGLHGFRYMKISLDSLPGDAPDALPYGEIELRGAALQFTALLGTPDTYTGWFESSDRALNRYWYDASYTNELGTDTFRASDVDPRNAATPGLEGKLVLHDGAKRDRDPYVGDLAVSGRTAYLTHSVKEAASNVLADLADHQRADGYIPPASINNYTLPLFEYPLYWVTSTWDYTLYNGAEGFASKYYPNLVKLLDTWYPSVTDGQGLLNKGLNGTGGYGDYAFLGRGGEVTYYNALYVLALDDAAKMATALGHDDDAARWEQRARAVSASINAHLWDPAAGAYLDSASGPVRHGQDGNSLAVVAGVATGPRAASALGYLSSATSRPYGNAFMDNNTLVPDGTQRVYAFTSYPELQARFMTGQVSSGLDEIGRLYGWMSAHGPGHTDWEGIGAGGSQYEGGFTSDAHGWSTGVLPVLTNQLLGVEPSGPGFSTWTLQPHPGSVQWARGQVPTPHGPIQVSWKQGSHSSLRVTAVVPAGTTAQVRIPVGTGRFQLRIDGRDLPSGRVSAEGRAGYVTAPSLRPGTHVITLGPVG